MGCVRISACIGKTESWKEFNMEILANLIPEKLRLAHEREIGVWEAEAEEKVKVERKK